MRHGLGAHIRYDTRSTAHERARGFVLGVDRATHEFEYPSANLRGVPLRRDDPATLGGAVGVPPHILGLGAQAVADRILEVRATAGPGDFHRAREFGYVSPLAERRLCVPRDLVQGPAGLGRDVLRRSSGADAGLDLSGTERLQG